MTWKWPRIVFFCLFYSFAHGCGAPESEPSSLESREDSYTIQAFRFKSFDGAELAAKIFLPKSEYFTGPRPTVIFANSWGLNESEYDGQARRLAKLGYIALSYATRGFSTSEDYVTVGSSNDIKDVSALIDWLGANTDADLQNLAMGGLSYGAGISLLAAAQEPRIKTVFAISGWGNLEQALYGQNTIRNTWTRMLLSSAQLVGRLSPEIKENLTRLRRNTEVDVVKRWAAERSPLTYVDEINARKVPIFIANSYQDNLFPPMQIRKFYEKLEGPKKFYLDRGIHASSAFPGLFGLPSSIWDETIAWLDFWLRGIDNGTNNKAPLTFVVNKRSELYGTFPAMYSNKTDLALKPLNRGKSGAEAEAAKALSIALSGGYDSGATSGVPLINESLDGLLGQPIKKHIARIDMRYAAVYESPILQQGGRIRGAPKVTVYLDPHPSPLQLVAYLYDVDERGVGTLVCHGVLSRRQGQDTASKVELDLAIAAYNVEAGHKLVVALDTLDPLYENPSSDYYSLSLKRADPEATSIEIPLLP